MPSSHEDRPSPADDDWKAEFADDYDDRKAEGGDWEFLDDDEIVLIQIQEFHDEALAETYRKERELEDAKNSD